MFKKNNCAVSSSGRKKVDIGKVHVGFVMFPLFLSRLSLGVAKALCLHQLSITCYFNFSAL